MEWQSVIDGARGRLITVMCAVAVLAACFFDPVEGKRQGNFLIELKTEHAMGHRATAVTLFDNSAARPRKIATVRYYFIPPHDPSLLVYDTCEGLEPTCTLWYYDTDRGEPQFVASGQEVSISDLDQEDHWSPQECCFIVAGQYHAVLVNTVDGRSFDLQEPLRIGRPVNPVNGRFRQVYFNGWDPLSGAATFDVRSPVGESDWETETYHVTNAGEVRLMSTVRE